jgi:hypothetical protein
MPREIVKRLTIATDCMCSECEGKSEHYVVNADATPGSILKFAAGQESDLFVLCRANTKEAAERIADLWNAAADDAVVDLSHVQVEGRA